MKLSLKYLILSVALLSILITFISSITSVNEINKQTLIEGTLETNRVYAKKLSDTVDVFFNMTYQSLKYSAEHISQHMEDGNQHYLMQEAERLKLQSNTLNSILIANTKGEVIAASPQQLDLVGKIMNLEGSREALEMQKPVISKPYEGISGRLIIFISYPIFNDAGQYLGLVGGSIYLLEDNFLNELLGSHYYEDGSYVYVVDEDGIIIYHKDHLRIGELVNYNPVVNQLMNGQSGAMAVTNSKGIEMLAGYAHVPSSNWGIVAQRPKAVTLAPNSKMINDMVLNVLPSLVLSIILVIVISRIIALPLQKLAHLVEVSTTRNQLTKLSSVKSWYYEAIQLKRALNYSMNFFYDKVDIITAESNTDPLTGLSNRRTLEKYTNKMIAKEQPFTLVIIDIDHFKQVNDNYGHALGDQVLIHLALSMKEAVEDKGTCFRFGGEEFIMLLPNFTLEQGFELAEQIRLNICEINNPTGKQITVSAGIAAYKQDADNAVDLFNIADKRLYEAKSNGRNQSNKGMESPLERVSYFI